MMMTTVAEAQTVAGEPRTVTVSASGEVSAEPDFASISTGVTSEAPSAREALARNTKDMSAVVDGLKAMGIAGNDIQTSQVHVEPRYQHFKDGRPAAVTGYRVSNQVRVYVRKLDSLGSVLDTLVGLGANQMGGLSFEVSNAETLRDEARQAAVANALRRAKLFAAATGAEVGAVLSISEETAHVAPRGRVMARQAMAAEAVPIERGVATLQARVTITWLLK